MQIGDLMRMSGVAFGTSGARGLVQEMTDRVCYAYTTGFLCALREAGLLAPPSAVGIGGDRRPSTRRIMTACARAVVDQGCQPSNLGLIPSPAVAAWGLARSVPTLMVTGSHIPDDRNGIKFNLPTGEILKRDEARIRAQRMTLDEDLFDASGAFRHDQTGVLPRLDVRAERDYQRRYLDFFPAACLNGLRVGVYEHSSVASDSYVAVLEGLGARVTRLARSEVFVPVDTEAVRHEDMALARSWAAQGDFDALVSADGDGDRPLISDETGAWLRGDLAGLLCALQLGARGVVTPVSSNTAVERCGCFEQVVRTRIGSPFVIEGMEDLLARGVSPVVGYEANGGFMLGSDLVREGRVLPALPTRDAILVALAILEAAVRQGKPVSALARGLPARFTHSDRLTDFPSARAQSQLAALDSGDPLRDRAAVEDLFAAAFGAVASLDRTDGLRISFASGEIAHLRPSGNAPELRAYTEADSAERAQAMNRICLAILSRWRDAD
ncbi:phosphomannomutase [Thiocapsa imhoffii]|uniref:Phosphomannomutase n=1 Tax=Thiocapsa imhoffii TaxID=382777 RepID=A0A9X1B758_9GAMM|nr:phosphomannomutase [Thiocapsa imhoffii]MBK1643489.1 phosphomannomutase [Thiocapsa imhoffii]